MKLMPHTLIRVAGGPFQKLQSLNLSRSIEIIDNILNLKEKLTPLKENISEVMYSAIPQLQDTTVQNFLVKLRRDIFNERNVSEEKLKRAAPHLSAELTADIENYRTLKGEIKELFEEGERQFPEETKATRQILQNLAEDENLQKGLVLSSQSLYKRIAGYAKKSKLKKKDFQVERGLTKYISRMYGKTSPFSTFTNLVMASVTPSPDAVEDKVSPLVKTGSDEIPEILNHIRLNNFLYQYLHTILTKNPDFYRHFLVRPNPTIKKNEDHYLFLTNSNNIEAFQRIPANPALEVFTYISTQKKEGIVYKEMVREIIKNEYIDAPAETLEDFINQLLDYGFLEFNIGVSGIDPDWDRALTEKLSPLAADLPLIKELLDVLEKVRILAGEYGQSDCENRTRILDEAFQVFRAICWKLHEAAGLPEDERKTPEELEKIRTEKRKEAEAKRKEAEEAAKEKGEEAPVTPKNEEEKPTEDTGEEIEEDEDDQPFKQLGSTYFQFKPENIFYEDASLHLSPQLEDTHLQSFTEILHGMLMRFKPFEGLYSERAKMVHYFTGKYPKDASVDLLTFYEDYYREFKKPEAKKIEKKETDDLPKIPGIEARQKKSKQWSEHFKAHLEKTVDKNADQVTITRHDLDAAAGKIDFETSETVTSYGCFIHLYVDEAEKGEKLNGVLNSTFPGFGRMFSRFLHIFPDAVTHDVRDWNTALAEGEYLLMENTDASYFNANLHPPLMPYEIRTPNGHNTLPSEQQIPVTELQVRLNEKEALLELFHVPTGKRAFVFDLGFQGHKGRSQLFQLLEKFSKAEYLFCQPALNAVNSLRPPDKDKTAVQILPRIMYEDRIVLQRKAWYIPQEQIPFRKPEESDWAWFYRINEWRRKHGIPEEIFSFIVDRRTADNLPPEKRRKAGRDDYKPQYISFKSPFMLNLLEKALKRVPDTWKIEEMLPAPRHLLSIGPNRYVTEFVLQWYTNP